MPKRFVTQTLPWLSMFMPLLLNPVLKLSTLLGSAAGKRVTLSLLLTTHHLEEAEARCSRTVIIDHGKVIASGTLPELVDRTVGRHRLVTLRVDAPLGAAVFTSGSTGIRHDSGIEIDAADPRVVRARLTDVGLELPPLLDRLRQAGRTVEDLDVRGPSLQAVFIHLTGRELRE